MIYYFLAWKNIVVLFHVIYEYGDENIWYFQIFLSEIDFHGV